MFVRTKHGADRLVQKLRRHDLDAVAMHGDLTQNARERALKRFDSGQVRTLVATDVAARGLDLDKIATVINFDPPEDNKGYIHRVGRTGRAGRSGTGVTLVLQEQQVDVSRIAAHLELGRRVQGDRHEDRRATAGVHLAARPRLSLVVAREGRREPVACAADASGTDYPRNGAHARDGVDHTVGRHAPGRAYLASRGRRRRPGAGDPRVPALPSERRHRLARCPPLPVSGRARAMPPCGSTSAARASRTGSSRTSTCRRSSQTRAR